MPIQWTPSLAVGVPEIDAQHQELFRRAERLIVALRAGDRSEVGPLFRYLSEYVVAHFEAEERLMRARSYPEHGGHEAEHRKFRADFQELAARFDEKGPTALLALTLHNWLSDWLRRHIGGADRDLGRFVQRAAR
ncbi:bacteriohemerythrin [Anaeromyxobacter oryzae]|uniref:Hemerythrin n=1 Tax=Anaeromyxobacter oryzae TaxID=2918170 RepID=A0ABN6MXP1_9BACT|nr:bacteriohemerythrin [Anaeromyxobacter oryzae]BDG05341.1 hemerythrin [Anaeromyxobacter oryzae]